MIVEDVDDGGGFLRDGDEEVGIISSREIWASGQGEGASLEH